MLAYRELHFATLECRVVATLCDTRSSRAAVRGHQSARVCEALAFIEAVGEAAAVTPTDEPLPAPPGLQGLPRGRPCSHGVSTVTRRPGCKLQARPPP